MHLFHPVFVLMLLTLAVLFRLGFLRYRAVAQRQVEPGYYKLFWGSSEGEPEESRLYARHLHNLLEMPQLFYFTTVIAFVTGQTGTLVVALCWAYVAARVIHSAIHLTSNRVPRRFMAFVFSNLVLVALVVTVAVGVTRPGV